MKILDLIETDFVNYKKPCMTVMFPTCTFKCNWEVGRVVCQNYDCRKMHPIDIDASEIVDKYINNPVTEAIVMQGLEPFDSYDELFYLILRFIAVSEDDIVIYTGYNRNEIEDEVSGLCELVEKNRLIIKFGRFLPDSESVFDKVLGVNLPSSNQYAEIVNKGE